MVKEPDLREAQNWAGSRSRRTGIDLSKFQEGCERMGGEYIDSLVYSRCHLEENGQKKGQLLYNKRSNTISLQTEYGSADLHDPTEVSFNFTSDFDELVVKKEDPERIQQVEQFVRENHQVNKRAGLDYRKEWEEA